MPSFWLEFEQNGQSQEFDFNTSTVSIGRDKSSDFVLDHPTVSRQHALIVEDKNGYQLVVLSRGGLTAIDGNQVEGEVDLYDGSVLHFGQLNFTFRSHDAPKKPASQQSTGGDQQMGRQMGQQGGFGGGQQMNQPGGPGGGQQMGQQGGFGGGQQMSQSQEHGGFGGGGPAFGGGGQQPQQDGWGQQQQQGGGAQQGGWGQMGLGGESSSVQQQQQAPVGGGDEEAGGIVSWDEIAESAEARGGTADGPDGPQTDYDRIQAAQKKAEEQSEGSNPVILIGGGIGIVLMMVWIFMPADGPTLMGEADKPKSFEEQPYYRWTKKQADCIGKADCMQQAKQAYTVGSAYLDKKETDISNLFEGWKQLAKVDQLLKKEGLQRPPELEDIDTKRQAARAELDDLFRNNRVKFHTAKKRNMYRKMADSLNELKAYFPDKNAREHQWALRREREMKDEGTYPQSIH